ncbi:hypothetical protein ESA_04337 [Cronobacter sakazakii ATCC BAA-894]|uniref:Uncharacterized protein n=1 Tax=Cronobacter sakazakii (strain ATCC BAA-894) TaxID=290339 RepID=A7MGC6_CROS8|nr:hypothetical protein ESA_04337 [Cronobacter sakazakii ATCC BAA-894]
MFRICYKSHPLNPHFVTVSAFLKKIIFSVKTKTGGGSHRINRLLRIRVRLWLAKRLFSHFTLTSRKGVIFTA